MIHTLRRLLVVCLLSFFMNSLASAAITVKGIYITQSTLENTAYLTYLINRAKSSGINTFVVDLDRPTSRYQDSINLIKSNNISYVARITVFPDGGTREQVSDQSLWEKKLVLVKRAIEYGADQIQLDYIRYDTKQKASQENAENIFKIVRWFKDQLIAHNIPLQIDVFGIASFGPELHIGQDLKLLSKTVDAMCPMVNPSHYEPYVHHANTPYETVYDSLVSLRKQFNNNPPFKLYPYIELSNYRYPLSKEKKLDYIRAQLKATEEGGADGWYVWSPHNKYDNLFQILEANAKGPS